MVSSSGKPLPALSYVVCAPVEIRVTVAVKLLMLVLVGSAMENSCHLNISPKIPFEVPSWKFAGVVVMVVFKVELLIGLLRGV